MISHRLVGRERELLELTTSLGRAKGGSGGALIVAGPPGIGKTRLAMELAAAAQADGVGVHWGRCWQGDVAPAFWPWVQVLRSMEADDSALHGSRGLGRELLGRCLEAASALSLRRLLLYATDDARPLYASVGLAPNPSWMELPLNVAASRGASRLHVLSRELGRTAREDGAGWGS